MQEQNWFIFFTFLFKYLFFLELKCNILEYHLGSHNIQSLFFLALKMIFRKITKNLNLY
jgi:hypothetical protein